MDGQEQDPEIEIDEDEIDQAEIDNVREHAANPLAPRTVIHYFEAPAPEDARRFSEALNAQFGEAGGVASTGDFSGVDPQKAFDDDGNPYTYGITFEHTAVVDEAYMQVIRDLEHMGQAANVSYDGWEADEE